MKCVVTGGTGFLGSNLTRRLSEEGHQVTVVSRTRGHDIRRAETLEEPLAGAEVVFHLAALVQSRPGPFENTNLEGLKNVLEVSRAQGVGTFVYASSFTVFGPSFEAVHREDSVPERTDFFHGYDRTKYEGYRIVEAWEGPPRKVTVFPTVIFGPGPMTEGNVLVRLLQRWKMLRVATLPGRGQPVWNFVYVDDVVDGLVRCLGAPGDGGYILGGQDHSLEDLYQTFRRVSGFRIGAVRLPDFLFKAGAYFEDVASRIGRFPPLVLPATADFFVHNWRFSSAKARRELGYEPRPLEQALESTCQWMKEKGMV